MSKCICHRHWLCLCLLVVYLLVPNQARDGHCQILSCHQTLSLQLKRAFSVYYEKARFEQLSSWEHRTYLAEESLGSVWSGRHLNILMKRDRLG